MSTFKIHGKLTYSTWKVNLFRYTIRKKRTPKGCFGFFLDLYSIVPSFFPHQDCCSPSSVIWICSLAICHKGHVNCVFAYWYFCSHMDIIVSHKGHLNCAVYRCVSLLLFHFLSRVTLPCATHLLIYVSPNGGKVEQNWIRKLPRICANNP
jgi:hypothetical protein